MMQTIRKKIAAVLTLPVRYPIITVCLLITFTILSMTRAYKTKKYSSLPEDMVTPLSPQNCIIVFDIHEVLFTVNYGEIFNILKNVKHKTRFILNILRPTVLYECIKLASTHAVAEQYILEIPKKVPQLQPYILDGIAVANAQTPIEDTFKMIRQLDKLGYEVHILSNIGPTILHDLEKRYPDYFTVFSKRRVVHPEDRYLRKPQHGIYTDYLERHNPDNKTIIFIDDKWRNIAAAHRQGIIGIHFKSPQQCTQKLEALLNTKLS